MSPASTKILRSGPIFQEFQFLTSLSDNPLHSPLVPLLTSLRTGMIIGGIYVMSTFKSGTPREIFLLLTNDSGRIAEM